jgi:type I restriction enzyme S subunit
LYELAVGDVLISLDRPIISGGIKVARVSDDDLPALLLQRVGRFLLDTNKIDAGYLYFFLQTDRFITEIAGHEQSLGVPHISPTQVEAINIPLPAVSAQKQLAKNLLEIADAWSAASIALQQKLSELAVLPQRILAQAFKN